jgi:hypothetical protein
MLLLGVALAISAWAIASYHRGTRGAREQRLRERQGARNVLRAQSETCAVCGEPVTPASDFFDEKTRTWWHDRCWRESIK